MKKEKQIIVKISEKEKGFLRADAEKLGLTISAYIRMLVIQARAAAR